MDGGNRCIRDVNPEAVFRTAQNNVQQNDLIAQSDRSVIFLPSCLLS